MIFFELYNCCSDFLEHNQKFTVTTPFPFMADLFFFRNSEISSEFLKKTNLHTRRRLLLRSEKRIDAALVYAPSVPHKQSATDVEPILQFGWFYVNVFND